MEYENEKTELYKIFSSKYPLFLVQATDVSFLAVLRESKDADAFGVLSISNSDVERNLDKPDFGASEFLENIQFMTAQAQTSRCLAEISGGNYLNTAFYRRFLFKLDETGLVGTSAFRKQETLAEYLRLKETNEKNPASVLEAGYFRFLKKVATKIGYNPLQAELELIEILTEKGGIVAFAETLTKRKEYISHVLHNEDAF